MAGAMSAADVERLGKDSDAQWRERAGNKDAPIPEWTGRLTKPPAVGSPRWATSTRSKDEKPLFSINAQNLDKYKDKLSPACRPC